MILSLEEQRLVAEYRKLGTSAQGDAMSYITALSRHAATAQGSQCSISQEPSHPETKKETIFTE